MLVKERILNHAPRLENTVKFLAGIISGLTTEKPFFWQGMAICPFKNNNIVFNHTRLKTSLIALKFLSQGKKKKELLY